jgi:hypothetical protein
MRRRMIHEHSAFLTWALRQQRTPRIPRRRVADGGFDRHMRRPEARAAVRHWWQWVLRRLGG